MKINKSLLMSIVCLLVSIAFTVFNTCSRPKIKVETKTVYLKDTTTHTVNVPKPKPIYTKLPPDTFIKRIPYVDSAYCRQLAIEFYSAKVYNQNLVDDSLLTASILYSIGKNSMNDLKFTYKINRPQTINITTTTIEAEKPNFGLSIGATVTKLPANMSVSPAVLLNVKRHSFGYSYDFVNKYHYGSYFYKILGR